MSLISYFKKYPEKNYQLEVIVNCTKGEKIGSIVDTKKHGLDYIPTGKFLYKKGEMMLDRISKFTKEVWEYVHDFNFNNDNGYPDGIVIDFIDYWTEPNTEGTKFKKEFQKTWILAGRLAAWDAAVEGLDIMLSDSARI